MNKTQEAEDYYIDKRGCSRETARTYLRTETQEEQSTREAITCARTAERVIYIIGFGGNEYLRRYNAQSDSVLLTREHDSALAFSSEKEAANFAQLVGGRVLCSAR